MMAERIYRKLTVADLPLVMEMENNFRSNFVHGENARLFLSNSMNWLFACVENGQIIGFTYGYELNRLNSDGNMLYIHEVSVLPLFQRQGVGKEILNNVKALCKRSNICKFFLFTEKSNTAACALYDSVGGTPAHDDNVAYFFNS